MDSQEAGIVPDTDWLVDHGRYDGNGTCCEPIIYLRKDTPL